MSEETPEARRLDRRGFLGAAAGVAAAGASGVAVAFGGQVGVARADVRGGRVQRSRRRGAARSTTRSPAAAWNTTALFQRLHHVHEDAQLQRVGVRRQLPDRSPATGNPGTQRRRARRLDRARAATRRRTASGSSARTTARRRRALRPGQRDHEDERVGLQPARRRLRLPERGGQPAGRGHGDHQPERDLGVAGERRHDEHVGPGVPDRTAAPACSASRPYGAGVFNGTALTSGRPCARYYRHFHSEQGKWIQNTGHEVRQPLHLRGHLHGDRPQRRVRAVGPVLAAGRPVDGGRRRAERRPPGRRRPEPGPGQEPPGAAGHRSSAGRTASSTFHIKDLGPNDQGTRSPTSATTTRPGRGDVPVRRGAVGDRRIAGHGSVPEDLRAVPPSGVPRVPVRARRHERHRHDQRVLARSSTSRRST